MAAKLGAAGTYLLLAATLLLAILPGGYSPRFTGPCGKQLCLCQVSPTPDQPDTAPITTPESRWILVEQAGSGDGIVMVLHSLLQVEPAQSPEVVSSGERTTDGVPSSVLPDYSNISLDLTVPPPRA